MSTDHICAAIKDTFEDTRAICEPAGAVSLAGLKRYVEKHQIENQTLVAVNSGAIYEFRSLTSCFRAFELGEEREALIAVQIPEQPGQFQAILQDHRQTPDH